LKYFSNRCYIKVESCANSAELYQYRIFAASHDWIRQDPQTMEGGELMPTGMLRIDINTNISSLNGRRLARQGPGDLLRNATRFLVNDRGLGDGDFISVTEGTGTTPNLLFVQDAQRLGPEFMLTAAAGTKKAKKARKKTAKKGAKKTTKRRAKKAASKKARKTSKKSSSKGSGSKKTGKKSSKK
jgi:hypothetical protein